MRFMADVNKNERVGYLNIDESFYSYANMRPCEPEEVTLRMITDAIMASRNSELWVYGMSRYAENWNAHSKP